MIKTHRTSTKQPGRPRLALAASIVDWTSLAVLGATTLVLALSTKRKSVQEAPQLRPGATPTRNAAPSTAALEQGRGRQAQNPAQIPARGWWDILKRTWKEINDDHVPLVAAGVTFYAMLAFFPGLGAFVALYGLFADVSEARHQLQSLAIVLPPDIVKFIGDEMIRVASARNGGLSVAFATGLLLAIWSANGGQGVLPGSQHRL